MSWCYRVLNRYKYHLCASALGIALLDHTQQRSTLQIANAQANVTAITSNDRLQLNPFQTLTARCKDDKESAGFEFIADAAEKALPAVVSIDVKQRQFVYEVQGSGSGFIVDKRGYIITNEHVVAGNKHVTVVFSDGSKLPGAVVAVDSRTDLALVKVESVDHLPEVRMGDDTKLRPGQWVVAIGNSLHFPNTVTAGIVSNTARSITDNEMLRYQAPKVGKSKYVQTDAAINPGSSGGPLVNLAGEVIAVNTMGILQNASGIAFSIPVSEVKRFLHEFSNEAKHKASGSKVTYSLGLRIITLTPGMAHFLHHKEKLDPSLTSGVFVFDTSRNSPAHKAGLVKGDVIIAVDNYEVHSKADLIESVQNCGGNPVRITFYRPERGFLYIDITPGKS